MSRHRCFVITTKTRPVVVRMDREDVPLWLSRSWQKNKRGALCSKTNQLFHRLILRTPRVQGTVFLNGDVFDCRKSNLRLEPMEELRKKPKRPFVKRYNNFGGPCGVYLAAEERNGNVFRYYVANVCLRGVRYKKCFYTKKMGAEKARRLAWKWRLNKVRELGCRQRAPKVPPARKQPKAGVYFEDLYGGRADYENCQLIVGGTLSLSYVPTREVEG